METKSKCIIGVISSAILIGVIVIIVVCIQPDGLSPPVTPTPPPQGDIIEGNKCDYLKTQDPNKGDNYFKFVPKMKGQGPTVVTYKTFFEKISSDVGFLNDFLKVLKEGTNFDQYYFECKPVEKSTFSTQGFEFVLKRAKDLEGRVPNFEVYKNKLNQCQSQSKAVSFDFGLSNEFMLVCPCLPNNANDQSKYTHLAKFVKEAPESDSQSVFKKVATVINEKVTQSSDANQKWYLSTDGAGTAWLHVRIGKEARYYSFDDYRFADL